MTTHAPRASRIRSVRRFVVHAVSGVILLFALTVIAVAVLIPRVAGATPYAVLTNSMEPHYPAGTLVVIRPTPVEDITSSTVIAYQRESGRPAVVTHRVVAVSVSSDGGRFFTTQGDANPIADRDPVREVQVRGTLWYAVPRLGWANTLMDGDQRQSAVYAAAGGLVVYALAMFGAAARDRVRRHRGPTRSAILE